MPNWCNCEITMIDSPNNMKRFVKESKLKNSMLKAHAALDVGESPIINWGTKWPDQIHKTWDEIFDSIETDQEVSVGFDTPWSPPIDGFVKISEKFSDANFALFWVEYGNQYCGGATIKNGDMVWTTHSLDFPKLEFDPSNDKSFNDYLSKIDHFINGIRDETYEKYYSKVG